MQDNLAEQLSKSDYPHYIMSLFAPRKKRQALWVVYALNYELGRIRSLVNEPMMGLIRIQWWREAVAKLYNGEVLRQQTLQEIDKVRHLVPEQFLQNLVDSHELDLRKQYFDSIQDYISHAEIMGLSLWNPIWHVWQSSVCEPLLRIIVSGEYILRHIDNDVRCIYLDKNAIRNDIFKKINLVDRRIIKNSPAFLCYNFIKWYLKYDIRGKKPNELMLGFYFWRKSIGF